MGDWYNSEPLGWACSLGKLSTAIELIKHGANPFGHRNLAGHRP